MPSIGTRRMEILIAILLVLSEAANFVRSDATHQSDGPSVKTVASAAATSTSHVRGSSKCAGLCFQKAQKLGFERVAGDSLACFLGYQGKRLGTYDCCDKAEVLLGSKGDLAECFCCPEFAEALLGSLPYGKLGTTREKYLDRLHLCRVPLLGRNTCSSSVLAGNSQPPTESKFIPAATNVAGQGSSNSVSNSNTVSTASVSSSSSGGSSSNASQPASKLEPIPLMTSFNLTGLYPWVGFDSRFDAGVLAAQGRAAVAAGEIEPVQVIGASPIYNDYIAGFVMWIEKETPRYTTPKMPELPPLPEQYKADVEYVASLRRGPYPDLVKNRPEQYSPAKTDPLQNGEISNLPPGPAFAGRFQNLRPPPSASP